MHYYTYTHVPAVRQYLYNSLCTCMLVHVSAGAGAGVQQCVTDNESKDDSGK